MKNEASARALLAVRFMTRVPRPLPPHSLRRDSNNTRHRITRPQIITMALPASLGHPTVGGKSLDNLPVNPYASHPSADEHQAQAHEQRTPYKSWRKKYRKMRAIFDEVLEENKKLFKEEMKLEGIAKRLREELE